MSDLFFTPFVFYERWKWINSIYAKLAVSPIFNKHSEICFPQAREKAQLFPPLKRNSDFSHHQLNIPKEAKWWNDQALLVLDHDTLYKQINGGLPLTFCREWADPEEGWAIWKAGRRQTKLPRGNRHPLGYCNWARVFQTYLTLKVMTILSLKQSVHLALW